MISIQHLRVFWRMVRVAMTPRSSRLRTRLSNGAVVTGLNRRGYGGRGVYIYRDQLEPELMAMDRFLAPGSTFIDIGANVGVYTLKAATAVGREGLVLSVEPFLASASVLLDNVRANRFDNVRVRSLCMGEKTEPRDFFLNNGTPNAFSLSPIGSPERVSVLCVSLDDLCEWENIVRIDYIKIDAEGAETAILRGASRCIARHRPIIQAETTIDPIRSSELPGYARLSVPGSPNGVFIPTGNTTAIGMALGLGWTRA